MTWWEFAIVVALVPISVEISIRLRWKEIRGMFDRALMHGGSLDSLARAIHADSDEAKTLAQGAVEAVTLLKKSVDESQTRLDLLENHPLLRRFGERGGK